MGHFCRMAGCEESIKTYRSDQCEVIFLDQLQRSGYDKSIAKSSTLQEMNSSQGFSSNVPEFSEFFRIRESSSMSDFVDLNDFSSGGQVRAMFER
jgi:hypothetical protein